MRLKDITTKEFDKFYSLLEQDFPYLERKTKESQLNDYVNCDNFHICYIYDGNKKIGYFTYWEFDEFVFGEHLAVFQEYRNHGYGTKFVRFFGPLLNKPVVFEVDMPSTEIAKRRIKFYERNNFVVNDFEYYQPSYHNGDDKIQMKILTYGNTITKQQFDKYNKLIRKHVYHK